MKVYVSACIVKKSGSKDGFINKLKELKEEAKKNKMCLSYDIYYTEYVAFVVEEWMAFGLNGEIEITEEHKAIVDYLKENELFTSAVFNGIKNTFESGFKLEKI